MLVFACSSCRHSLSVADAHAGRSVRCPACRAIFQAPTATLQTSAAPAPAALAFLAPRQRPDELGRLGAYRVLKVLGGGGMGLVLLAHEPAADRQVAIKVLRPDRAADPQARQRFQREARLTARVSHDHVVPVYFVGEERGTPYLVMPLLRGEPLDARLARDKRLTIPEAVRIGCEMAEALAAAHALGLIHRDIKPSNVWLEAPNGRVKVLDFGLARGGDGSVTGSGAVLGTPAYMAPEQAAGLPLDARADLFALGCVLYEMLTGERAFSGPDVMAVFRRLATHEPPPPRQVNPAVPSALSDLVARLMSKDAAARPASAAEVADRLRRLEADLAPRPEPYKVPTSQIPQLAAKPAAPARRRRWLALLAAAAALLLVSVLAWRWGFGGRAPTDDWRAEENTRTDGGAPHNRDGLGRDKDPGGDKIPPRKEEPTDAPPLLVLRGQLSQVKAVAWSPDGKRLVSAGPGAWINVWDVEAGQWLRTLRDDGSTGINGVAWSPDGRTVATAANDHLVVLWDAGDGKRLADLRGHTSDVLCVAFSPDGKTLASGGMDGTIRLWDLTKRPESKSIEAAPPARLGVQCLAWHRDGELLLAGLSSSFGGDGEIRCWRVKDRTPAPGFAEVPSTGRSVAWSPDGERLVTTSNLQRVDRGPALVRVWAFRDKGRELLTLPQHSQAVAFSPDGKRIATCSRSIGSHQVGWAQLWDAETGELLRSFAGKGGECNCLAFSPDGRRLAVGTGTDGAWVYDLAAGAELPVIKPEPPLRPSPLSTAPPEDRPLFSPDGRLLAVAEYKMSGFAEELGSIALVDIAEGRLRTRLIGHRSHVMSMAFRADDKRLVSVDRERVLRLWDTTTGRSESSYTVDGIGPLVLSPDGRYLAAFDYDSHDVVLYAVWPRGPAFKRLKHPTELKRWLFSPDGRLLATVDVGGKVRVWHLPPDGEAPEWAGTPKDIDDLAFSREGQLLALTRVGQVSVWRTDQGKVGEEFSFHDERNPSVSPWAFSADLKRGARSAGLTDARLFDLAAKIELVTLTSGKTRVLYVAVSPDGKVVAGVCDDGSVRLWNAGGPTRFVDAPPP
jgi:WD40 repeat protein